MKTVSCVYGVAHWLKDTSLRDVTLCVLQVDNLMNSPEALHKIVESIPGLNSDPAALCKSWMN